ncbi:MAG: hypothetical protein B6D45_02615, partial [Ignavibacteriales bacterium UTCHB3]
MLEPKLFYRNLDALLAGIGKEKTGQDFLVNILMKLEDTFGKDLQISRGRIYEGVAGNFELIYPVIEKPEEAAGSSVGSAGDEASVGGEGSVGSEGSDGSEGNVDGEGSVGSE